MIIALLLSFVLNIILILINPSTLDAIERILEKSIERTK